VQHRSQLAGNSPIARPLRGAVCRFLYAAFLSRRDIATAGEADHTLRGLREGAEAPWHVRDRGQVRVTNHGTTIPQSMRASASGGEMAVLQKCGPPL
jgi:hypothetical protein